MLGLAPQGMPVSRKGGLIPSTLKSDPVNLVQEGPPRRQTYPSSLVFLAINFDQRKHYLSHLPSLPFSSKTKN